MTAYIRIEKRKPWPQKAGIKEEMTYVSNVKRDFKDG